MAMKFALGILTLAFIASTAKSHYIVTNDVSNHDLLGTNECTYGPSFWCSNLTHASRCSATQHCISKVWTALQLPPDNDDVCKICKDMVQQARDQLLSNETMDELRQVLEGSCALIPLKEISEECKKLMDNFLPELVDALASRMDPQTVCAVSGLCNNGRIDLLLQQRNINCSSCSFYVDKFLRDLNDTEKLENLLLEQCTYLGSYSDGCSRAVREEFGNIVKYLGKVNGREFCELLNICKDGEKTAKLEISEDLSCSFCKQLVLYMKNFLSQNSTREEFDSVVKGFCKAVAKGKFEGECLEFFETYGSEIYKLLIQDVDPEEFCGRVGICPDEKKQPTPLFTTLAIRQKEPMKPLETGGPLKIQSPQCTLCSYITLRFQDYLNDPTTEKSAEDFIENLCSKHLPKEMSEQCDEFVVNYGDAFIQAVAGEIQPGEICPLLKLCPKKKLLGGVNDILPTCSLCQFTVGKLIDLIGKNRTKESIEKATAEVCNLMPHRYADSCNAFMKNYGDQVIEMILIEGSSHEICAALHLCLFLEENSVPMEKQVTNDDPKCVLCEYVISTLASRIKDNATESEIKTEVLSICHRLPKTINKECTDFVNLYGDEVIQFLAQEMDPMEICTELKLCRASVRCTVCNIISSYIKISSTTPKFISAPMETTREFCAKLRSDRNVCVEVVEDYFDYLVAVGDNEDVCRVVDLC